MATVDDMIDDEFAPSDDEFSQSIEPALVFLNSRMVDAAVTDLQQRLEDTKARAEIAAKTADRLREMARNFESQIEELQTLRAVNLEEMLLSMSDMEFADIVESRSATKGDKLDRNHMGKNQDEFDRKADTGNRFRNKVQKHSVNTRPPI